MANTWPKCFGNQAIDIVTELTKEYYIICNIRNHGNFHIPKERQTIEEIIIDSIRYYTLKFVQNYKKIMCVEINDNN